LPDAQNHLAVRPTLCFYSIRTVCQLHQSVLPGFEAEVAVNIFDGTAEELERWFHEADQQHLLMCFLLAASARDRTLFQTLINEVVEMDSVLGEKISFILFREPEDMHSDTRDDRTSRNAIVFQGQTDRWGGMARGEAVMAGERLLPAGRAPKRPTRVIDELYTLQSLDEREHVRNEHVYNSVVKSSQKIIPDLCEHFEIAPGGMPAVVVLAKGIDEHFLFPLGETAQYMSVLHFVHELANILRQTEDVLEDGLIIETQVRELKVAFSRIEKRKEEIRHAVEGLRRKHHIPEEPLKIFLLAVHAGRSDLSFRSVIAALPDFVSTLKDERVTKVDRLLQEIQDVASNVNDIVGIRTGDLLASVDQQVNRSREILARLGELRHDNQRSRNMKQLKRRIGQVNDIAEKANLWVDIAEKIHKFWPLLAGIGHHS
jgi:hypothetical protein